MTPTEYAFESKTEVKFASEIVLNTDKASFVKNTQAQKAVVDAFKISLGESKVTVTLGNITEGVGRHRRQLRSSQINVECITTLVLEYFPEGSTAAVVVSALSTAITKAVEGGDFAENLEDSFVSNDVTDTFTNEAVIIVGDSEVSREAASDDDDYAGDDDFCFHVNTEIDYKGVGYSYEELRAGKEPECTVPHSPSTKGVVITTSCDKAVRVTDTHLMATTKGFQLAYSLKAGDVLFGDYEGDIMCIVQSVEKEKTTQQYFGLNCVHSEVLASGLRASTFGDFHALPSWYMTYVGGLVGAETASMWGEYIAGWYFYQL